MRDSVWRTVGDTDGLKARENIGMMFEASLNAQPPNKALNQTCHSGLPWAGVAFSSQESPLWHAGQLGR